MSKLIYVAHPYGGAKENKESVGNIVREFYQMFPRDIFISPIHAFGFMYEDVDYKTGLFYCLNMLKQCDLLIMCPGWEESRGCMAEWELATLLQIPIVEYSCSKELFVQKMALTLRANREQRSLGDGFESVEGLINE